VYYVEQSASFEALAEIGVSGLAGTIAVAIDDGQGNTVSGPTSVGIIELDVGGQPTGWYRANLTAPAALGQYGIVWSPDGTFDPELNTTDVLTVVEAGAGAALPPIAPIGPGPGAVSGPCNAWTTADEIAACCDVEGIGSDTSVLDDVATEASRVLFELGGRIHGGTCEMTVRPCATQDICGFQVLDRGHVVSWEGFRWLSNGSTPCGCLPLSQVLLPGYPVKEILEVKVDGVAIDPSGYRLDNWRTLTRLDGGFWPACQWLDRDDDEEGTWSVRYTWGQNPPDIGRRAASQLACEIYKSCAGVDCAPPARATRTTRQGITVELSNFRRDQVTGLYSTGMGWVDWYLNSVNPTGRLRRPGVWSPDAPRFAKVVR